MDYPSQFALVLSLPCHPHEDSEGTEKECRTGASSTVSKGSPDLELRGSYWLCVLGIHCSGFTRDCGAGLPEVTLKLVEMKRLPC